MSAYAPIEPWRGAAVLAVLALLLVTGYGIARLRRLALARLLAWTVVVAATASVERLVAAEPAGLRMLAIIGALLFAMKAVVAAEERADLSPLRWLAFAGLWPGMQPAPFRAAFGPPLAGASAFAAKGLLRLALGLALVLAARLAWAHTGSRILATACLLPGLSLILHFGLFNLAVALWRALGVEVGSLFVAPLRSTSLREFWGRRWNLAFSHMTATGVYRPLSGVAGKPVALLLAFVASGLLHELAISVPVRAGYGLPLLYFALHGGLMQVERALERRGAPIGARPWRGRAWTTFWLVAPLPILFHRPFLAGAVWPIIGATP